MYNRRWTMNQMLKESCELITMAFVKRELSICSSVAQSYPRWLVAFDLLHNIVVFVLHIDL
jgi:hypothetical protein